MDEIVALYDEHGRECGTAPRSRVRALNLRHGATGILVRRGTDEIFLHRRTTTKDVFPGLYDFAAGGVLAAGEDPYHGAVRELAEELGITGVALTALGEADYADEHTNYRAFLYLVDWSGPVRLQPEEVDWGDWVTRGELLDRVRRTPGEFVPDTVALWHDRLPEVLG